MNRVILRSAIGVGSQWALVDHRLPTSLKSMLRCTYMLDNVHHIKHH